MCNPPFPGFVYYIVPSLWYRNQPGSYYLNIYSDGWLLLILHYVILYYVIWFLVLKFNKIFVILNWYIHYIHIATAEFDVEGGVRIQVENAPLQRPPKNIETRKKENNNNNYNNNNNNNNLITLLNSFFLFFLQ